MSHPPFNGIFDTMEVKKLSSSLFNDVKSSCVELSKLSLDPTIDMGESARTIEGLLGKIAENLDAHRESNRNAGVYVLSAGVGDYIFFPLSGILKRSGLGEAITGKILYILGFLMEYSWRYAGEAKLIEQLYPLVVVLCGRDADSRPQIVHKSFDFIQSVVYCLKGLVVMASDDFFTKNPKNLGLLGDTTTILLDTLKVYINPSVEQSKSVNDSLETMILLCGEKIASEQMAYIFPGTMSSLVNFFTSSRNLHFTIIVNLIKLLSVIIAKVFDDKDLKADFDSTNDYKSLNGLSELWEETKNNHEGSVSSELSEPRVEISIGSTSPHRSKSWLSATSTQLKISLNVFFRHLLISSSINKLKVQTKPQIRSEVLKFIEKLQASCFVSLFTTIQILGIDVLGLIIDISCGDEPDIKEVLLEEFSSVVCLEHVEVFDREDKLRHLQDIVDSKMGDLIGEKLSSILLSSDENKIMCYISTLELYFAISHKISKGLSDDGTHLREKKVFLMKSFRGELINTLIYKNGTKKDTRNLLSMLQGNKGNDEKSNVLENIELPPHVNADKLVKLRSNSNESLDKSVVTSDLRMLLNRWGSSFDSLASNVRHHYFSSIYTPTIENGLHSLFRFICTIGFDSGNVLEFAEQIFESVSVANYHDVDFLDESISLWLVNILISTSKMENKIVGSRMENDGFDIHEFVNFSNTSTEALESGSELEEVSYLVLSKAQQLIDRISGLILEPELSSRVENKNKFNTKEVSYCIALESLGLLSSSMSFEDFRNDVLIDYLFPLIESLTVQSSPEIQSRAKKSLQMITDRFYNGSLESLIVDNSDYLIDCISLKLASSQITPSLSGILLILLKVAGVKLMQSNQLNDIVTEMFLLIDAHHGYSVLLEGFFIVFEELLNLVLKSYGAPETAQKLENESFNSSTWKPWGMSNINQLLKLVAVTEGSIDQMEGYNSGEEYFKNPGKPFGEDDSIVDSDDEDGDSATEATDNASSASDDDEKAWSCYIPKETYMTVQKILKYGFLMLSHPSFSLRSQVLNTMTRAYPILASNYDLILPIISANWSMILSSLSGSDTVSTIKENQAPLSPEKANLILPSLALAMEIIERDQEEKFFAKQFIDSWDFLVNHSRIFSHSKPTKSKENDMVIFSDKSQIITTKISPRVIRGYVIYFLKGLCIYDRKIPEKSAYNIVKVCCQVGIPPDIELNRDVKNLIWVIENTN